MSLIKVFLDDFELTGLVSVESINTGILPEIINNTVGNLITPGENHLSKKVGVKPIPIKIRIPSKNLAETKRFLAGILYSPKSIKLKTTAEPNIFYNVHIDGNTDVERLTWQSPCTLLFIAYDGLAHAVQPKTFTNEFQPTFISQPNSYEKGDTYLVPEDDIYAWTEDLKNKQTGSDVECPHEAHWGGGLSLHTPNSSMIEFDQGRYNNIKTLDGLTANASTTTKDSMAQERITYNILESFRRKAPSEFAGMTEAEQVAKTKALIKKLDMPVWAKGSGPSGSKFTYSIFTRDTSYTGNAVSTADSITKLTFSPNYPATGNFISKDGYLYGNLHAEPSNGDKASNINLDYTSLSIESINPYAGKLIVATKDSDTFDLADWEPYTPENVITIDNQGTYRAPMKYIVEFKEDSNFIAFTTDYAIIQLGEPDLYASPTIAPSETIYVDEMTPATKSKWSEKAVRIRWRPTTSVNAGALTWRSGDVWASSFGNQKDCWHGPSLIRYWMKEDVLNWEATFRVGHMQSANKPQIRQQGMTEGNIVDADNNFIAGFEIKKGHSDNEVVDYVFFVGDTNVYAGKVPAKHKNFFGNVDIKKTGNRFDFDITGYDARTWKKLWTYHVTRYNDDVANLSAHAQTIWFGVWSDEPTMYQRCSYTKAVKINTSHFDDVPLTFYKGDRLEISEDLKTFINGSPAQDWLADASDKIYYEPGKTELKVQCDTNPDVTTVLEEVYL